MSRQIVMVAFFALVATGCQTPTADRTAALALQHLGKYEREVGAKIAAEEAYYDYVMNKATERIDRIRHQEQVPALLDRARAFADAQGASPEANRVGPKLAGLTDAAMKEWARNEDEYDKLLSTTRTELTEGRKKLELEHKKIKQLRGKLRAVGESRDAAANLKFIAAYAKAVGKAVSDAEKESKPSK
jgi:hypothetical protein